MAACHVTVNIRTIRERFRACPNSLDVLAVRLADQASEYRKLQRQTTIVNVRAGMYLVDLLGNRSYLDKCYIGLVAGNFIKSTGIKSADIKSADIKSADIKSADIKSADIK